jgi:hypothetical protein
MQVSLVRLLSAADLRSTPMGHSHCERFGDYLRAGQQRAEVLAPQGRGSPRNRFGRLR